MTEIKEIVESVFDSCSWEKSFLDEQRITLNWLERQTHTRTNHAQMLVGKQEGAFLYSFTKTLFKRSFSLPNNFSSNKLHPNRFNLLEIGTFTGYSLLCFAFALKELAGEFPDKEFMIDALEINDELEYLINEAIERGRVKNFVDVKFTDDIDYLSNINSLHVNSIQYDLVFIDANKRNYLDYYKLLFPLLKSGGYVLADNVNWYGKTTAKHDPKTQGIVEFNECIANETKNHLIQSYLFPIRDGLYVIKKL